LLRLRAEDATIFALLFWAIHLKMVAWNSGSLYHFLHLYGSECGEIRQKRIAAVT
jgi:hypothetical protein